MKKKLLIIIPVMAVIVCIIAIVYYRDALFLPAWISWQEKDVQLADGRNLKLSANKIGLYRNGELLWNGDKNWKVQDVLCSDLDHDGSEELIMLLWKRGRYGYAKPFWVEKDEISWSQHIFIYSLDGDKPRPKWCASDIGRLAEDICLVPKAPFIIQLTDINGDVTFWEWNSWGLSEVQRRISGEG